MALKPLANRSEPPDMTENSNFQQCRSPRETGLSRHAINATLSGVVPSALETTGLLADFLADLQLEQLSTSTIKHYTRQLRTFQEWLDDRPVSPDAARHFLAHLRARGCRPSTVKSYYSPLRAFLAYLGMPFQVKFPRERPIPVYHDTASVQALLDATLARSDTWRGLQDRDRLIILTLALTGLRCAELCALRPRDIAGGYLYVRSGKGNKDRAIPLAEDLRQPLADYIKANAIAPSASIFGIKPRTLQYIVSTYSRRAGVAMHPHSLRHYFATSLLERGASLPSIQHLLGHSSLETTQVYLDVVPAHLQQSMSLLNGSLRPQNGAHPGEESPSGHNQPHSQLRHSVQLRPEPHPHDRSAGQVETIRPGDEDPIIHNAADGRLPEK